MAIPSAATSRTETAKNVAKPKMQDNFDLLVAAKIKEGTDNGLYYCSLVLMPCYKPYFRGFVNRAIPCRSCTRCQRAFTWS